jgi:hypothetical protein
MGVTELRREERSPTSRVETIGKSPDTRHHPLSNGRGHASGHGSVRVNGRASAHGNVHAAVWTRSLSRACLRSYTCV